MGFSVCFKIIAPSRLTPGFAFLLQTAEYIEVEVSLSRVDGSLGFNIMGGSEVKNIETISLKLLRDDFDLFPVIVWGSLFMSRN